MPIKKEATDMTPFLKSKHYAAILPQEISDQFCRAMQFAGIRYSGEIIADGRLHRFHIEGQKQGSLNGAYTLHLDGCPAGWFMDYKTGLSKTWGSRSGFKVSYALIKKMRLPNSGEKWRCARNRLQQLTRPFQYGVNANQSSNKIILIW